MYTSYNTVVVVVVVVVVIAEVVVLVVVDVVVVIGVHAEQALVTVATGLPFVTETLT